MSTRRLIHALFGLCFLLSLAAPARAATVCVSSVGALTAALDSFDGQPDGSVLTIKLVQGTYAVGAALGAHWHSAYPHSVGLRLLGGYTANCASRHVDPSNTTVDGMGRTGAFLGVTLDDDTDALIEGITFTRLKGEATTGSAIALGLDAGTSDVASVEIRYSRVLNSSGVHIVFLQSAQMRFVDNLVAGNTTSGDRASAVHASYSYDADSMLVATNNTIVGNAGGAGLAVETLDDPSGRISEIADNVLWHNGNPDLDLRRFASSANALLVSYNQIGAIAGYTANSTNLASDPRFVDEAGGNYRLASNSPAINSGAFLQTWGFPAHDIAGGARIVGSRIDRGAFESSIDDTTTAVVTTTSDNGNDAAPTPGSLRAAIKAGNAAAGPFRIVFNVAGSCPRLLSLAAPMLDVTGDVTIDGTTQSGWAPNDRYGAFDANLCFYVNGAADPDTPWALHVPSDAPSSARLVVRGLGFAGFADAAIKLEGGRNHRIAGNQFGAVPFTPANAEAIRVTGASGGAFIGGYDDPAALNLIAGGSGAAVHLDNASGGSTVANNVIGFQADGIGDGGNTGGVLVFNSPGNAIQYNTIGHDASNAITLAGAAASGNLVQYNTIGENAGGEAAPNASAGVLISFAAKNNTVGAPLNATWGGNFIVNSGSAGVWVSPSGGSGNRVLDNVFYGNAGLDVDLAQAGPSANQPTNPATGPNGLQNYPVLVSASRDPSTDTETVTGTLTSAANTTYRLDLYWAADCSAGGRGSARFPLMKTYVTTGALGTVPFSATVPFGWGQLPAGGISGIATDPAGNTSEIGNCVAETFSDRIFRDGFD